MYRQEQGSEVVTVVRDCDAVVIPFGTPVTLRAGQQVTITQALGGSLTCYVEGNLVRVDAKDADALGKEAIETVAEVQDHSDSVVDEDAVWKQLATCYDPEIPINIVELGLVYECNIIPIEEGGSRVEVKMTLTAPGCGMGPFLAQDVEGKLRQIPGVMDVRVELVFDPPWNQGMMSEAAKLQAGLL